MFKQDLTFRTPLLNAAGSLGFAPNPRGPLDLGQLGAFTTHPISRHARQPAENRGVQTFPGGFLLHTGLPNPGFRAVLKRYAVMWAEAPFPVLVHLIPESQDGMSEMAQGLESLENIAGIELGLRDDVLLAEAMGLIQAGLGELPLIACLPFTRAAELSPILAKSGAAALSLAPARGRLPGAGHGTITGRLYGPALFPLALEAVSAAANTGLPVIGSGGVYTLADVAAMRMAGAQAVALDAVLWRGWETPSNLLI